MKLKYYLRGMGIGIILTAIVMGFALGGRKAAISDAEVIQRAKALGMVEEQAGTLAQTTLEIEKTNEESLPSSGKALDTTGNRLPAQDQQQAPETDLSDPGLAEAPQEGESQINTEAAETGKADSKGTTGEGTDLTQNAAAQNTTDAASAVKSSAENVSAQASSEKSESSTVSEQAVAGASLQVSDSAVPVAEAATTASSADQAAATTSTGASSESSAEASNSVAAASTASTAPPVKGRSVTIPKGCGSDTVAEILFKEGLVDNAVSFNQYLVTTGMDRKLRAGVKVIPEDGDYQHIAEVLIQG